MRIFHNPQDRERRVNKVDIPPRVLEGVTIEVQPGSSIRVKAPEFDRTWHVGDEAQHVHFKYSYVDGRVGVDDLPIAEITENAVKFRNDSGRVRRTSPFEFAEDQLFPAPAEDSYGSAVNPVWAKPRKPKGTGSR